MAKDETITFRCPKEVADRLNRLAEKADIPRSKLVGNIVDEISKDLEICGKVGILQFTVIIRDMKKNLEAWAKKVKSKKVESL